jgi:hypothetical protein
MQIGSIEIIKSYAEQVHKKILRQQARCAVYLVKRYLGYLRLGAANIKAFKAKEARAKSLIAKKQLRRKRVLFKAIQRTLYAERVWLQEVIAEFNSNRLEQVLTCWKSYVKYCHVQESRKLTLYSVFLQEC